jgi:signal transduction histidine kinase/CheY-like chemotaxis protein
VAAGYAAGLMAEQPPVDTLVQREMLQVALRNAANSIPLLLMAFGVVAWQGWSVARTGPALAVAVMAVVVALWRWHLRRRCPDTSALTLPQVRRVVTELEGNALLAGLMWSVATALIYPSLQGISASVYLIVLAGSVATAAFFLSMAGRSFALLMSAQVGSLALVSLLLPEVRSAALAVLSVVFGLTMMQATRAFRDVTQRSMRLALEMREANASLLRAKEAAEAANVAKSRFLATMSHEIRTPMNGVLGALDVLRSTSLDARQRRLVQTAASSGESLMDILNDVLDHSKIEAGKMQQSLAPMSLHALLASAAALFSANAESRGLTLALDLDGSVPDGVLGDAPRLKQVLLNLLGNAVKFTERGSITLQARGTPVAPEHVQVCFTVRDTGIGIPAAAIQQVFEPFHQVDGTRSRSRGGTGLGLAISQRIVQAMGGCISVRSGLGQGSTFEFTLDLPLAPVPVSRAVDSGFGALDAPEPPAGVVLLVEDNEVNRMIGAEMLKDFGVEVVEAEDGAQCLQVLESRGVDLVLMDIQMPVLDGCAAAQRIRAREQTLGLARVPIVALTANAFEDDTVHSRAAGMDDHLAKPYTREQLRGVLQRWLPQAQAALPLSS